MRSLAARGAAAAAAPQTAAESSLSSAERVRLRTLALEWLQADVAMWAKRFDAAQTLKSLAIEDALSRWHASPYLASIRDPAVLRVLPESEMQQFASVWAEVAALQNKVRQLKNESLDTLLPQGSRWAYLADGSNPGTAWRQGDFDDAAWKRGQGPLGYGEPEMATEIGFGAASKAKHITSYFRATFTIGRLDPYQRVVLRLRRDDGAAVYLNGREILRDNLPREDPLAFDTLTPQPTDSTAETDYHLHETEITALQSGTNTVTVEVHQVTPQNGDLVFDLEILALRKK